MPKGGPKASTATGTPPTKGTDPKQHNGPGNLPLNLKTTKPGHYGG